MAAVKAVADTRSEATGPALALFGCGSRNRDRDKTVHAGCGIVLLPPGKTAVHHDLDSLDGQAGFGDIRGQHDLAFSPGQNRPFLFFKGEIGIKGMNGQDFFLAF